MRLGDIAPNFSAESTQGTIQFHEFKKNQWCILFSHPEDFTPVCTTELAQVAQLSKEWESRNTLVLGLSCDSLDKHHSWIKDIQEFGKVSCELPIIADPTREVATLYNMLDYQDPTNIDRDGMPLTVRSVFIVDPSNVIRATITYPASTGRNFYEILRLLDSLLLVSKHKVATPSNWQPGEKVIVHNSLKNEEAKKIFGEFQSVKPYLRFTDCPEH